MLIGIGKDWSLKQMITENLHKLLYFNKIEKHIKFLWFYLCCQINISNDTWLYDVHFYRSKSIVKCMTNYNRFPACFTNSSTYISAKNLYKSPISNSIWSGSWWACITFWEIKRISDLTIPIHRNCVHLISCLFTWKDNFHMYIYIFTTILLIFNK